MTDRRGGGIILVSFLIALLLTILPLPEYAQSYRPQWVTLVLIYWTLATPQRVSVGVGWTMGILLDVITGTLLGQHALSLSLIAYLTHETHQRVRLYPLWQQALIVLTLLLLEKVISLWVMGAISQPGPGSLHWLPPLIGMLLWPWLYIVMRDLRRKFRVS